MKKIAIVGSGISGMGTAWYLRDKAQITIFEKGTYAGGHTNTVMVQDGDREIPVDTGFIVFNFHTYPRLCALFEDLGIESADSDMSFSVWNRRNNLQFCGSGLDGLFAQRRNIFRPAYYRFLSDIARFRKESVLHMDTPAAAMPLGEYLKKNRYSPRFAEDFIIPMSSAVWSTPPGKMMQFPAQTLIKFFDNHNFLALNKKYRWRYVKGGSNTYTHALNRRLGDVIRLPEEVKSVRRSGAKVELQTSAGPLEFDYAILASHAPDTLRILSDATPEETRILSAFRYEPNQAILHTDSSVMPPSKKVWSSWNYKLSPDGRACTVYHMNRLQKLPTSVNWFVSINETDQVDPATIHSVIDYEHPLFDTAAVEAQPLVHKLNGSSNVFFAGAYFRYGFHEDGMVGAESAARALISKMLAEG